MVAWKKDESTQEIHFVFRQIPFTKRSAIMDKEQTMSKYYKAEDVIRSIKEMQIYDGWSNKFGIKATIMGVLESLPTITVPKIINGVGLKDCDKVIEQFLEEHECDELWEAVRALRDFYDWVAEEESKDDE